MNFISHTLKVFLTYVLVAYILVAPSYNLGAITRYAGPAATGTGDGLSWANKSTVASALSAANPYDIILATNGTYGSINFGTKTAITLRSWIKHGAKVVGSPGTHGIYGNDYAGVSNVIDGMWITDSYIDGIKFNQQYLSVSNCLIERAGRGDPASVTNSDFSYTGQGFAAHHVSNLRFTHNIIRNGGRVMNGDHGIYVNGTNLLVAYNVVYSNMCWGLQFYHSPAYNHNIQVHNNIVWGNGNLPGSGGGAMVLYTVGAGSRAYVWNNTFQSYRYVCIHQGGGTAGTSYWTNNILFGGSGYNNVIPTSFAVAVGDYNWQNQNVGGDMSGANDVVTSTFTIATFFPTFTSGRFWLQPGSTAIGMGFLAQKPLYNFWGAMASASADVGAAEFSAAHGFDTRDFYSEADPGFHDMLFLGEPPLPTPPMFEAITTAPGEYFENCLPTYLPQ